MAGLVPAIVVWCSEEGTLMAKAAKRKQTKATAGKIGIENVIRPGPIRRVDAAMYEEMRRAYLKVLPKTSPGLTIAEIQDRLPRHLSQKLYPGGAKAGWWSKAVQLDLEAKGIIARTQGTPLRLHKA